MCSTKNKEINTISLIPFMTRLVMSAAVKPYSCLEQPFCLEAHGSYVANNYSETPQLQAYTASAPVERKLPVWEGSQQIVWLENYHRESMKHSWRWQKALFINSFRWWQQNTELLTTPPWLPTACLRLRLLPLELSAFSQPWQNISTSSLYALGFMWW